MVQTAGGLAMDAEMRGIPGIDAQRQLQQKGRGFAFLHQTSPFPCLFSYFFTRGEESVIVRFLSLVSVSTTPTAQAAPPCDAVDTSSSSTTHTFLAVGNAPRDQQRYSPPGASTE